MDIKNKIEEIIEKIKSDENFASKFKDDPEKAIESILGIDIPGDQIEKVIEGVKAKLSLDKADGVLGKIKKMF
ncbi:MAG: hypothetical protein SCL54_00660 [Bacillota bacterium]|nr:hypothetical protein [Bacillota bacterium]